MILDEIAEKTKIRVEKAKKKVSAEQMKKIAESQNPDTGFPFEKADPPH